LRSGLGSLGKEGVDLLIERGVYIYEVIACCALRVFGIGTNEAMTGPGRRVVEYVLYMHICIMICVCSFVEWQLCCHELKLSLL
jgi:hypothetical protein